MEFEIEIIKFLQAGRNGFLDVFFQVMTYLGSIYMAAFVFVLLLIFRRKYCLWFAGAFVSSYGVAFLLKHLVKRVRPFIANDAITCIGQLENGYSFPSGHSVVITCIAIFIGFLLFKYYKKAWQEALVVVFSSLIALVVVLSRMYLGVHYLTDTLAGIGIATIFTVTTLVVWHFYKKKKEVKNETENGD